MEGDAWRPWLVDAQRRILEKVNSATVGLRGESEWVIRDVVSLSDWQDHSIVRFAWQLGDLKGPGFAAVYRDAVYSLDSERTFVEYLVDSKLKIIPSLKDHLATALECAVLGWTAQKRRVDSAEELAKLADSIEPYKEVLAEIAPPFIEETSAERRLAVWIYHWSLEHMLVHWVAIQPKDGSRPTVQRSVQILPGA